MADVRRDKSGAPVKATRKPRVKKLATFTPEDRIEYLQRRSLFELKQREALAAANYMDQMGEDLRVKYDLPTIYNLDLETGIITEAS